MHALSKISLSITLLLSLFVIAGCTEENEPYLSDNLLQNPKFETNERGRRAPWLSTQHAGKTAYTLTFSDGEVTIDKYDEQVYFMIVQQLNIEAYENKTLRFRADLKLDMPLAENADPKVGGGLLIKLYSAPPAAMLGKKLVLQSTLDHQPHSGKTDWVTVFTDVVIPKGALKLEAGFAHMSPTGSMSMRNPTLRVVED